MTNQTIKQKRIKMPKKTYEQLVEENKWIKDLMTHASENMKKACQDRYELEQENEKLKKYETMVHCVWSDLYWADKGGCEVSFKDVSASCDYYENEEFIKKEVVDDSEED